MKGIKRYVTDVYNYVEISTPHGGSSNIITLECGHWVARKNSQGVPKFVYCRDCQNSIRKGEKK